MQSESPNSTCPSSLIEVRPEPPGHFAAQVVGLPELRATADSRDAALRQVEGRLAEWFAAGRLVTVAVPQANPLMKWFGRVNPNDPDEQAYLAELARLRQEDLERTSHDSGEPCPATSSTPTT